MIWLGLLCLLAGAVQAYVLIPATVLLLTAVVRLGLVNGLGPLGNRPMRRGDMDSPPGWLSRRKRCCSCVRPNSR